MSVELKFYYNTSCGGAIVNTKKVLCGGAIVNTKKVYKKVLYYLILIIIIIIYCLSYPL